MKLCVAYRPSLRKPRIAGRLAGAFCCNMPMRLFYLCALYAISSIWRKQAAAVTNKIRRAGTKYWRKRGAAPVCWRTAWARHHLSVPSRGSGRASAVGTRHLLPAAIRAGVRRYQERAERDASFAPFYGAITWLLHFLLAAHRSIWLRGG